MIEKLEKAEARFVKLEESLADPEIYKDQESYAALMKERKSLAPIIEKYRAYKAAVAARDGAAAATKPPSVGPTMILTFESMAMAELMSLSSTGSSVRYAG